MPRLKKTHRPPQSFPGAGVSGRSADTSADVPEFKLTLRLLRGADIAMGPGKAELLEGIIKTGSISAAGRSMEMSYRRAWLLVDEMNRCFKQRVVATAKGGRQGGGAEVTPFGLEVLRKYQETVETTHRVAFACIAQFKGLLAKDDSTVPRELPPDAPVQELAE